MISSQLGLLKSNRLSFLAIIFVVVFLGSFSRAAESLQDFFGATGSIRPSYWSKSKNFSSTNDFLVGSVWLTLRPAEVSGYRFYFDAYVQGSNLSRESMSQGDIREAFVEKTLGSIDFKVGRQIVVWGRADKLNPTDSFASKDLTLLMSDDEDQRLGQGAAQTVLNFDQFRLIGIWQPEWRSPIYPVQPQVGIQVQNITPEHEQNQFGIKLDRSGDEIDWSISYFDGFNKTPDLKLLSMGPSLQLGLDYGHIQVYGADFAKSVGRFGFRGEAAYTKTEDESGENPLQQNSNFFMVLGADQTIKENFNINAQILYKNVVDFQDPSLISDVNTRTLAIQQSINANQLYKEQLGLSLRPSFKGFNDTLEIEMAFVTWFKNTDSLLKPKLTYAISDATKFIVGAEIYNGPTNTFFGRLKDLSSIFSELRFLF